MIQKIIDDFRQMQQSFHKTGEVELFENLASSIARNSNSIFIRKTHGRSCLVTFKSIMGMDTTCEIADLLIISISRSGVKRATFLQAKREECSNWLSATNQSQFDFTGQFNQWDLLSRRPDIIKGTGDFKPQPTLLSSFNSASIGSFGVFYEQNSQIEVNYSIAEFISSEYPKFKNQPNAQTKMIINNYLFKYNTGLGSKKIIVRQTLEGFLEALFANQIGALIDETKPEHSWLVLYVRSQLIKKKRKLWYGNKTSISEEEFNNFWNSTPPEGSDIEDPSDGLSILIVKEQND